VHSLSLFLLFFAKLSAIDISYLAEILDRRRFGERKNSVVLAVLSLFSDVLVAEIQRTAKAAPPPEAGSARRDLHSDDNTIMLTFYQYYKCRSSTI
jgi:hypothetical protein